MKMRFVILCAMYILTAPILLVVAVGLTVFNAFMCIKDRLDFDDFLYIEDGLLEGFKQGHESNMHWVKSDEWEQ